MTDFFGNFDFWTGPDPTEGFVDYVDEATARQTNLINNNSTSAIQWGVETRKKAPHGRPSVRIASKKRYDSGLIVLDVAHMPFGCGTWPAFWTVGPNWPHNGEIDILEGVHEQTNNGMTLHTGPGCRIGQDTTQFAGSLHTGNCDVAANGQPANTGCSIQHPSTQSYGAGLNAIGGGVYVGDSPNPSGWGKPAAKFIGGCDIAQTFKQQQIVFDTTFCGQWAGSQGVWDSSSCSKKASTCVEYVRDNPKAFADAYWKINALKVYQDNGQDTGSPAPSYPVNDTPVSAIVPTTISSSLARYPAISSQYATPTEDPAAPAPLSHTSEDDTPEATYKEDAATPATPTRPATAKSPLSTGAGGLPGFQWPQAGPEDSSTPDRNSTSPAVDRPPSSTIVRHSTAPVVSSPASTPSTIRNPYPAHVKTGYQTVYKTVTACPEATPSPAARKVRMARRKREHRQRLTKDNARM